MRNMQVKKVINMSWVQDKEKYWVYGLHVAYHKPFVTQRLEHPTSVWKVIGSNSCQELRFVFVPQ